MCCIRKYICYPKCWEFKINLNSFDLEEDKGTGLRDWGIIQNPDTGYFTSKLISDLRV